MPKRNYKNLNPSIKEGIAGERGRIPPVFQIQLLPALTGFALSPSLFSLPPQHTHVHALDDTSAKHLVTRRLKHTESSDCQET